MGMKDRKKGESVSQSKRNKTSYNTVKIGATTEKVEKGANSTFVGKSLKCV